MGTFINQKAMLLKDKRKVFKRSNLGSETVKKRKNWQGLIYSLLLGGLLFGAPIVMATPSGLRIQIDGLAPYYTPTSAEVRVGTAIRWENPTATHHTITHDGCKSGRVCAFDSGAIAPNGKFELFDLPPGRYPYHCTLHPIMRGLVVVEEKGTSEEA